MEQLFASERIVDIILAATIVEAAVLVVAQRRTGRGIAPDVLLPNLLAGACLLLALRLSLGGAAWPWLALCLLAALLCHLADLRARWQS